MPYEMRDNSVQQVPDQSAPVDEQPQVEPGRLFEDAMSRLESITEEWTKAVQSVKR